MIIYTEKGLGLHNKIVRAGHWLIESNAGWQASDEAAVQAIIDGYSIGECKQEIQSRIDEHSANLRNKVTKGISPAEMASWSIKRDEAKKYKNTAQLGDVPTLEIEANARGVTIAVLVEKVIGNANQLAMMEATIAGVAGKHRDALSTKTTFADVLAYNWQTGWPEV